MLATQCYQVEPVAQLIRTRATYLSNQSRLDKAQASPLGVLVAKYTGAELDCSGGIKVAPDSLFPAT
jgi:hypothetical protein